MSTSTHSEGGIGVDTVISYWPGALPLRAAVALLQDADYGFAPTEAAIIISDGDDKVMAYAPSFWETLLGTSGADGFELTMGPPVGERRPVLAYHRRRDRDVISLSNVLPAHPLLDRLLGIDGLMAGASGDADDAMRQGETDVRTFELLHPEHWSRVRTQVETHTDKRGRQRIDVSNNPGRIQNTGGMLLWAAQDLWFGPASAVAIAYDAVMTLPVGRVEEVGDGVLHVHLYDGAADSPAARDAQRELRTHLGYDDAVARKREVIDALAGDTLEQDPRIIVRRGSFPHGGNRLVYTYWTEQKRRTVRSRATWLTVAEYDASEQVDWQEIDLRTEPHPDAPQS